MTIMMTTLWKKNKENDKDYVPETMPDEDEDEKLCEAETGLPRILVEGKTWQSN